MISPQPPKKYNLNIFIHYFLCFNSKRIPAPLNPCRNYSLNSESTHNFDPQFTRLPIDTIAQPESNPGPSPGTELNFDGFTYNDPCALYVADNAMRA